MSKTYFKSFAKARKEKLDKDGILTYFPLVRQETNEFVLSATDLLRLLMILLSFSRYDFVYNSCEQYHAGKIPAEVKNKNIRKMNFSKFIKAFIAGAVLSLVILLLVTLIFQAPNEVRVSDDSIRYYIMGGTLLLGMILYFPAIWLLGKVKTRWQWHSEHTFLFLVGIVCIIVGGLILINSFVGWALVIAGVVAMGITIAAVRSKELISET